MIREILSLTGLTPAEKLVLLALVKESDYKHRCALSNVHLGERVGLAPETISRAIRSLSKHGLVISHRRFNNSSVRTVVIDNLS